MNNLLLLQTMWRRANGPPAVSPAFMQCCVDEALAKLDDPLTFRPITISQLAVGQVVAFTYLWPKKNESLRIGVVKDIGETGVVTVWTLNLKKTDAATCQPAYRSYKLMGVRQLRRLVVDWTETFLETLGGLVCDTALPVKGRGEPST
jgi:hypothetical protein